MFVVAYVYICYRHALSTPSAVRVVSAYGGEAVVVWWKSKERLSVAHFFAGPRSQELRCSQIRFPSSSRPQDLAVVGRWSAKRTSLRESSHRLSTEMRVDLVMVPPGTTPPPATPTPASPSGIAAPSAAPPTISATSVIAANHAVRPMVVERVDSDLWLLITPTILDDDTRDELLEHADIGSAPRQQSLPHMSRVW